MAPNEGGYAPIYERLVGEQGDVLAQARQAADDAQRSARYALDVNGPSHQQPEAFSQQHTPFPGPDHSAPGGHAPPRADQPTGWFEPAAPPPGPPPA